MRETSCKMQNIQTLESGQGLIKEIVRSHPRLPSWAVLGWSKLLVVWNGLVSGIGVLN